MNTKGETSVNYFYKLMKSPVGELKLVATDRGLAAILWENDRPTRVRVGTPVESRNHPVLVETERQLKEYFAGKLEKFSLTLDPVGTEFQREVWNALSTIPFGETRSYGQIATQIKRPKAVRAVGTANGRNPISIVVPCHRVIGSNGKLTGFAGGLEVKAVLLGLESKQGMHLDFAEGQTKTHGKFVIENGVPVLPPTGELITAEKVQRIAEEEGI